jgi:hypothetical protein
MKRSTLMLPLALAAAACATPDSAGVGDPASFRRVAAQSSIESTHPALEVAQCFQAQATLLPMTRFSTTSASLVTYRLRGFGFTFEEIDFEAAPGGSRMTVFIAPNVNARWREDFERDRSAPSACAPPTRIDPRNARIRTPSEGIKK